MPDNASRLLYVDNRTNNGQHKYAYLYDKVGNRTSMMVTAGGVTRTHVYTYDNIYQVTGVDYPPELSYLATDSTFNYDAAGNRTSVIDGSGTCDYTTNYLNQYTAAGTTSYQYDDSGNMTTDGTYTYDYDPENRLIRTTKSGSPPPTTLAEALDLPLVYTTGGTREWLVNGSDYHTGLSSANSDNLNNAGETSWVETTVQAVGSGATLSFWWKSTEEGEEQNNTLDFRINGVVQPNGTLHGNSGPWEQRTYPLAAGTYTLRWTYSRDSQNDGGKGYLDGLTWDGVMPVLPEPDPAAWLTLAYRYDAAGRRVQKKYDNNIITKYVYDGDHCIAEYNAYNQLRRKYIYGPGVDEPISMIEAAGSYAGTYYYHFDGLGSVVGLTNASGNTVEVYEYDIYGRLGATDASHPNRFMFTGREYDKETGLYYYRARYYNPQIGRFLQTDPVGYGAGMNWYEYCKNSPLNGVDPSGLQTIYVYLAYGEGVDFFYKLTEATDGSGRAWDPEGIASQFAVDPSRLEPATFEGYGAGYVIRGVSDGYHNPAGTRGNLYDIATNGKVPSYVNGGKEREYSPAFNQEDQDYLLNYELTPREGTLGWPTPFKEVYKSIWDSGRVPEGWEPTGSRQYDNITNNKLRGSLRSTRTGRWRKVYQEGRVGNRKCTMHWAEHIKTKEVVDVEPHWD